MKTKTALIQKLTCFIIFISFLFPDRSFSQQLDSLLYYQDQLSTLRKEMEDSLKNLDAYKRAMAGVERNIGASRDYTGLALVSGIIHSNYEIFNQHIAQDGFGPMDPLSAQYGIGVSTTADNFIFDLYFFTASTGSKSTKGGEKISTSMMNAIQSNYGVNIIRSRIFKIYPYLGFSLRFASIDYTNPIQTNPAFVSVSDLMVSNTSVSLNSFKLGWQGGIGIDVLLHESRNGRSNIHLFIKPGVNRPIGRDKYKFEDITYDPKIKHGDWVVNFGVKFGTR